MLQEKGIKLFIASGRDMLIPAESKAIEPIRPLMDGFISSNGQRCFLTDGTEISFHPLSEELFLPLRRCCEENRIAILYYIGTNSYITEMTDHVKAFVEHVDVAIPPVRPIDDGMGAPQKICLYASPEDEARLLQPILKDRCYSARNTEHLIDLIPAGIGKDSGIREFCEYLGISREETMAFGDGENDISMMKEAGISVAMGNAEDRVKAAADFVTGTTEEGGITDALKHYGLI